MLQWLYGLLPSRTSCLTAELAQSLQAWCANHAFVEDVHRSGFLKDDALQGVLRDGLMALSSSSGCLGADDLLRLCDDEGMRRQAAKMHMSGLELFAGHMSFSNVLCLAAAGSVACSVVALLSLYLVPLITRLGEVELKLACWLLTSGAIAGGVAWAPATSPGVYTSLVGLLAIWPAWVFTFYTVRFRERRDVVWLWGVHWLDAMHALRVLEAVVWTTLAVLHDSRLIGFGAVVCLGVALHFALESRMRRVAAGDVVQLGDTSLVLTALYVALKLLQPAERSTEATGSQALAALFEDGLFLLGPVVYMAARTFLAVEDRWQPEGVRPQGFARQCVVVCAACAAAACVWVVAPQLKRLQQLSGTFFMLFALGRYWAEVMHVAGNSEALQAWALFGAGIVCFAIAWFTKMQPDYFVVHL